MIYSTIDNPRSSRIASGHAKYTPRMENQSLVNSTVNQCPAANLSKSFLARSKRQYLDNQNVHATTNKLVKTNFNHHDPQLCVCEQCSCGRHMCNFKMVKPDLKKSSIYLDDFRRKRPVENKINIAKETDTLRGPHIAMESRHKKQFQGREGDPNYRRRPQDLLKTGGQMQNLTSYGSGFPGHRADNQYVKPTVRATSSSGFPGQRDNNLESRMRSTYTNAFPNKSTSKPIKEKIPDNLKTSNLWLGKSSYGNFYQQPNPEDYAKKVKNIEKLELNPNYSKQYETTYKNGFPSQEIKVCQAKIALQTKSKGLFSNSKERFAENSDFKSLNPTYHAISTSRHSYV